MGCEMNAFGIKGSVPKFSTEVYVAVLFTNDSAKAVKVFLLAEGWHLRRIWTATADDCEELPRYEELMSQLKAASDHREADRQNRLAAEHADRDAEVRAAAARSRGASRHVIRDILEVEVEKAANGDGSLEVIARKLQMIIENPGLNWDSIQTALSLDTAGYLAKFSRTAPNACHLCKTMLATLSAISTSAKYLDEIASYIYRREQETNAALRAISSRSYVYGGSGVGLLLSSLEAERSVKRDSAEAGRIDEAYRRDVRESNRRSLNASDNIEVNIYRLTVLVETFLANAEQRRVKYDLLPEKLLYLATTF